ncbi:SDR family oxidoreductase [Aestuariicoccus sp. MJ-SS9]|uniref:SDR family oxidoreductase n=1 Tax=Aestuariicoccus sp. MJ-SS9 TaxID=3079855 RepID=UPI00290AE615|nr:SDR family oxidoreductase [Aestuariicoccus sp. MJ-SS9]MDU8911744.1 SDR family oxidoreductase [Aestuariicoccus sp. MJ-SS9]
MSKEISDQIVAITAGAGGIGLTIARHLAARGAALALCDTDAGALARVAAELPGALTMQADVSDDAAVAAFFARIADTHGRLDALIANAGIAGPTGGVDAISPAEFRRCVDVGLSGQFASAHHAVPLLRKAGGGAILCMSSVAGKYGYAFRTPYAATKFGVIGLAQSLAKELGPDDIRVNALLPGFVDGPRMRGVIADRAAEQDLSVEDMTAQYLSKVSLRRMVTEDDVAEMAAFLLSPAARNISGQSIAVDGNVETL